MKTLLLTAGWILFAASVGAGERRFDFNEVRQGELPPGFRSSIIGRGSPADWKIITADVTPIVAPLSPKSAVVTKRPVLAQLSTDKSDTRAPLLILDNEQFTDFTFTTRFRIVSGEVEQMAGIAFRLQDERNYYYVRANAKNQNVAFFRYVEGELIGPISAPTKVNRDEWNELTVECRGTKLRALLNEREVLPWTEPNLVPFPDGSSKGVFPRGKVAFWTKADSVVHFADARMTYAAHEPFAQTLVADTLKSNPRLVALRIFGLATNASGTRIIGSSDPNEIGQPGEKLERDCIEKGGVYFGKGKDVALVTMPLHDRNGETVGAVRVSMTTFFGQTENNAIARALPIVKSIEARIGSATELYDGAPPVR
jgi:hypothetical protein